MPDNLLQIVQNVCDELGLQRPAVVVNATDLQVRQLYAFVNRELREIQQNYEWTALQSEYDLVVTAPVFGLGDLAQGSPIIQNVSLASAQTSDANGDFSPDFGSPVPITTIVAPNWVLFAQGIPVNARVIAVDSGANTLTLSEPASATILQTNLTISQDTYPPPADFDRYINQTWWDRTNRWALLGPDSPQMDQWHRSGVVTTGPRRHFRQIGYGAQGGAFTTGFSSGFSGGAPASNYRLWPPPGAADTPINIAFEYISANAVISSSGGAQPKFLADDDVTVLDSQILVLGTKWRMWQIKGFDYSDMQQEYQDYVDRKFANDGGAKTLSLSRNQSSGLTGGITQDGNFPGPIGPNAN